MGTLVGTYVGAKFTNSGLWYSRFLAKINPTIPNILPFSDWHITVLYSRKALSKVDEVRMGEDSLEEWKCHPIGFDIYPYKGNKCALVLKLDAPNIVALHDELISKGGTHDYPSYNPHVTISYDVPPSTNPSRFLAPFFPLRFSRIYTEPLELDWEPK